MRIPLTGLLIQRQPGKLTRRGPDATQNLSLVLHFSPCIAPYNQQLSQFRKRTSTVLACWLQPLFRNTRSGLRKNFQKNFWRSTGLQILFDSLHQTGELFVKEVLQNVFLLCICEEVVKWHKLLATETIQEKFFPKLSDSCFLGET